MWGPLLALALLVTVNPVRIGVALLVLSRPRPMHNLFAYWAGALVAMLIVLLVPLAVIYATPTSASFAERFVDPTPNSTSGHVAVGLGLLALAIAALVLLRSPATRSERQNIPRSKARRMSNSDDKSQDNVSSSTLVLDTGNIPVISRLLQAPPDTATEGASGIRRMLSRARGAWDNGSLWIAFVIGFVSAVSIDGALVVLALIVGSGAGIAIQFSAAIAYIVVMLAVEEIILVSSLITPAKTQAGLRRLHEWALAHRRKLVAAIFAVVGISALAKGMGVI